MVGSMGCVGAAGDNAAMKSFFSLLHKNVLGRSPRATRGGRTDRDCQVDRVDLPHRRRRQSALDG